MKINKLKGYTSCPSFFQIDLKDVTLKIVDGAANEIEIKIGEVNFTWTEARNIDYTLDRGNLDEVRLDDDIPVNVSFDFIWEFISGTGIIPTIEDALKKRGPAAAWVSTDADGCRPYAVDLVLINAPNCGASSNPVETITIQDFRWESLDHDLRAGTISCSGQANVTEADSVRS